MALAPSLTLATLGLVGFFPMQAGMGLAAGFLVGKLAVVLNNRINLDAAGLYPILTAASGLLAYGLAASLGGSGFLSVIVLDAPDTWTLSWGCSPRPLPRSSPPTLRPARRRTRGAKRDGERGRERAADRREHMPCTRLLRRSGSVHDLQARERCWHG